MHQVLEVTLGWKEDLDRALTAHLDLKDHPVPKGRLALMGRKVTGVYQALWGTTGPQALVDHHPIQTYMGPQGTLGNVVCLVSMVLKDTLDILDPKALMGGMATQEMGREAVQVNLGLMDCAQEDQAHLDSEEIWGSWVYQVPME